LSFFKRTTALLVVAVSTTTIALPLWRAKAEFVSWRWLVNDVVLVLLGALLMVGVRYADNRIVTRVAAAIVGVRLLLVLALSGWFVVKVAEAASLAGSYDATDRATLTSAMFGVRFWMSILDGMLEVIVLAVLLYLLIQRIRHRPVAVSGLISE